MSEFKAHDGFVDGQIERNQPTQKRMVHLYPLEDEREILIHQEALFIRGWYGDVLPPPASGVSRRHPNIFYHRLSDVVLFLVRRNPYECVDAGRPIFVAAAAQLIDGHTELGNEFSVIPSALLRNLDR